jgi:hypothetical protein
MARAFSPYSDSLTALYPGQPPRLVCSGPLALPLRQCLSAAQPQPNDLGEVKAFVPRWALCRAALKRATSSPNGEMRVGSVAEKFQGKSLEARPDLQFRRRLSNIILGSKGRTLVTN